MNWSDHELKTIENDRQAESRGAVFLTWSQNRCNPACVVQQNTAPKIHWANVQLHNTASVPLHYTIAKTQQVLWCCLNYRTTATKRHISCHTVQITIRCEAFPNTEHKRRDWKGMSVAGSGRLCNVIPTSCPLFTGMWRCLLFWGPYRQLEVKNNIPIAPAAT